MEKTARQWFASGWSYEQIGKLTNAFECYERSLALDPSLSAVRVRRDRLEPRLRELTRPRPCPTCRAPITSDSAVGICAVCQQYPCPNGHCRCSRLAVEANRRPMISGDTSRWHRRDWDRRSLTLPPQPERRHPAEDYSRLRPGGLPYENHCWCCGEALSATSDERCDECGWLICSSGSCGCGRAKLWGND